MTFGGHSMTAPTSDMLIKAYIAIRNDIKEKDEVLKKHKVTLEAKKAVIEKELMRRLDADKVESIRSDYGTAFKSKKEFYNVEEWEDLLKFICEKCVAALAEAENSSDKKNSVLTYGEAVEALMINVPWHFFNKAISKTSAKDYLEENKVPPPGIKYTKETAISIRKS
jgi:hypothetical protein